MDSRMVMLFINLSREDVFVIIIFSLIGGLLGPYLVKKLFYRKNKK
jgi:uncharacterized membrane protein